MFCLSKVTLYEEVSISTGFKFCRPLARKLRRLALVGKNRDQIAEQLKISIETLDETLCAYRNRLEISLNQYRMADNAKIDKLAQALIPTRHLVIVVESWLRG